MKAALRAKLLAAREALSPEQRAAEQSVLEDQVRSLGRWGSAQAVCGYASMGSEASCDRLLDEALAAGKRVLLPRCAPGRRLLWHEVAPGWRGSLLIHPYGMGEPDPAGCPEADPASLDPESLLVLVPAVGLDGAGGFRLGYGGGYYDRFLARLSPRVFTLGLGYECQQVALYAAQEPTDVPLQAVAAPRLIWGPCPSSSLRPSAVSHR